MTDASMRALVTGATGFLGRHLTRRLVAEGHDVHIMARPTSNLAIFNEVSRSISVHMIEGTGDNLESIVATAAPDVTFHLATNFMAEHTAQDIGPLISANVLFPCRLVDAMARQGSQRLVNCSTAWQHFSGGEYNPVNLYAATKQAFLTLLKYYVDAQALTVVDLTISDTYGPDDPRPKLFSALYRASRGEQLAFSPGEQLLDIVYVDDVVDALLIAANMLEKDNRAQLARYRISGQHPIKLKEVVATFATVTGETPDIAWGARPYRPREMMVPWEGNSLLPGWRAQTGIADGIRQMHTFHVRDQKN